MHEPEYQIIKQEYEDNGGGSLTPAQSSDVVIKELTDKAKLNMQKYIIMGTLADEFIPTFFSSIQKTPANIGIGAAAVTLTDIGIQLIYDIKYFAEATKDQIDHVLSHELLHVVCMHFLRGFDLMDEYSMNKQEFFSKYMPLSDLPVNQMLTSLPAHAQEKDKLLTYDTAGVSYESFPTFEAVVRHAMSEEGKKMMDKLGLSGKGDSPTVVYVDASGGVEVLSEGSGKGKNKVVVVPEVTKEGENSHIQDIADIVRNCSRTAGRAPANLKRFIDQFLDDLDNRVIKGWELIEHYLIGERAVNRGGVRSYSRLNRRTKMLPGRKKITGFSAAFIVDESGSMSDDEVGLAFNLVKKVVLRENRDKVYVVHWDTEPHEEIDELQFDHEMEKVTRRKGGGTDFSKFFTHPINQRIDADVNVCVTDGYPYPWPETDPDKPTIWIITQKGGYDDWEQNYGKGLAVCVEQ
jgi:predicted metal-dependent peptidase